MALHIRGKSLTFGQKCTFGMFCYFMLLLLFSPTTLLIDAQCTNPLHPLAVPVSRSNRAIISSSAITNNNNNNNACCQWRIESLDEASIVKLDFANFTTLPNHDTVRIFDGFSLKSPLLAELSGHYKQPPTGIISSQKYMLIQFTTDQPLTSTSFRAIVTVEAEIAQLSNLACSASTRPEVTTSYSGTLTSPSYPYNYPNDAHCEWLIVSWEPSGWVKLDFSYFYTENFNDFVSIHDGNSSAPVFMKLSGYHSNPLRGITSSQRFMTIKFQSDRTLTYSGFKVSFTSTTREYIPTRLSGGSSREGRLEVYRNGQWGSVCERYFDNYDAKVACYGLGYGNIGRYVGNKYVDYDNFNYLVSGLRCSGSETSIAQCSQDDFNSIASLPECFSRYDSVSISCTSNPLPVWQAILITLGAVICTFLIIAILCVCTSGGFRKKQSRNRNTADASSNNEPAVVYTSNEYQNTAYENEIGFQPYDIVAPPAYETCAVSSEPQADLAKPPAYNSQCIVCLVKPCENVSLIPCGHAAFCNDCVTKLTSNHRKCPICHQRVDSAVSNPRY